MSNKNRDTTPLKTELKRAIKRKVAKAWYNLDQQSYHRWLEGRTIAKHEMQL